MHKFKSQSDPRVSRDTDRCAVACSLPVYIDLIQTHPRFHDSIFPVCDFIRPIFVQTIIHNLPNISIIFKSAEAADHSITVT